MNYIDVQRCFCLSIVHSLITFSLHSQRDPFLNIIRGRFFLSGLSHHQHDSRSFRVTRGPEDLFSDILSLHK
jgi:hypothetical protein